MRQVITLEEVQALATQEGYTLSSNEDHMVAVKTSHPHVFQIFERQPDFLLGQGRSEEYALMQVFYWIKSYDLSGGEDDNFLLHRSVKHPAYRPTEQVALHLDYVWNCNSSMRNLHTILQCWISTIEQLEQPEALRTLGQGTNPEDLRDVRIGQHARQLKTGQEGIIKTIWRWSKGDGIMDFLWVEGDGSRFCDLEENLDIKWSRRTYLQLPGKA